MDWPAEKFGELARLLMQEIGIPVVLTGSEHEAALLEAVSSFSAANHVRLDGQLNIKDLAALLKRSALIVANSTGPLHLAVAVGTQVIGLYYPFLPFSPSRWGPYQRPDSVIMPPVEKCREMISTRAKSGNCMQLITVQQVYQKAKEMLGFFESDI